MTAPESYQSLRASVREVCSAFPNAYWRRLDQAREYPEAFVQAMTEAGFLAALIPPEYGGLGLDLVETSVILEEINRSGGNAGTAHAQMYTMGAVLRHGSEAQKREYLPRIASGEARLQAFGVTEPEAGSDTTRLTTSAVRDGDSYVVDGRKIYISRVQHSDLMLLLTRTTPLDEVRKKSEGLSVFLVDLQAAIGQGLTVTPIPTTINNETNELQFENLRIPASTLIGEEGSGFKYILDGMNAERILIAANRSGNVMAVDATTGRSRVLVHGGRQGVFAPVTGDLANVTGGERRGHSTLIWVAGTQGRRRRHLLASTRIPVVEERALLWSPDGRSISYITGNVADVHPGLNTSGTRTLWVAGGGRLHPRRLVTDPAGSLFSPAWSPDSRGLAFIAAGACGSARECPNSTYLASVDIATGMRERIQYSGHQGASVLPHSQLTSVVWLAS